MSQRRGYVATIAGTVVGGVGLRTLGLYLGNVYAVRYMPNAELEVLLPLAIGSLGGYWIGTIAGAWAALRLRSYGDRLRTAVAAGILAPLPIAASVAMHSVVPADRTPVPSMTAGLLALAGIGAVARAIALWLSPGPAVQATGNSAGHHRANLMA